jgi:hypothetical protein
VTVVEVWTGRHAQALRLALRMTNEGFAAHLGTAVRTVAKWNSTPDLVPVTELQRALDTALARSADDARQRFSELAREPGALSTNPGDLDDAGAADLRLTTDAAIVDALRWIDDRAAWPPGTAAQRLRHELTAERLNSLRLAGQHSQPTVAATSAALRAIYQPTLPQPHRFYSARCDGWVAETSIVSRPGWLDLSVPLAQGKDDLVFTPQVTPASGAFEPPAAEAAIQRLAATVALGTRLVNAPLYHLTDLDVSADGIRGQVGLTDFAQYALTLDLLESELIAGLSRPDALDARPLRDMYMPHSQALLDIGGRLCAGGPLALTAIARPVGRRGPRRRDYVLLVQERSQHVLNATRRLAVIPKGFHGPLVDFTDDAQLGATLEREMEEELFGRPDVDSTIGDQRRADPMHITSLSAPMRWLISHTDAADWRMECVGFGINAMTGNFEFACLIVIDHEDWWSEFGGAIEANWETHNLRRISSLDAEGLTSLIRDPGWSNEGLFAFLQGLRRLSSIGGDRIHLPKIDVEL